MMQKKMIIKLTAGLMAAVMLFTSIAAQGMAADANGKTEGGKADYAATLPLFMEVADQLDPGEAVTAEDIEITAGDTFDPAKDFTGITYDGDKIKVHFSRAEDPEGKTFSNKKAAVYTATYYAEPLSSHHDYRFTRKVTVKDKAGNDAANAAGTSTDKKEKSGDAGSQNSPAKDDEGTEDEAGSTDHSDRKDAKETPASSTEAEKAADSTGSSQTSEEETAVSQHETEEAAEQDTSVENTEEGKVEAAALEESSMTWMRRAATM